MGSSPSRVAPSSTQSAEPDCASDARHQSHPEATARCLRYLDLNLSSRRDRLFRLLVTCGVVPVRKREQTGRELRNYRNMPYIFFPYLKRGSIQCRPYAYQDIFPYLESWGSILATSS
eukprot:4101365-Prymnesium_polylepis.1